MQIEQNSVRDAFDFMAAWRNLRQMSNLKVLLTLERSVMTSGPLHDVQRKVVHILPNLVLILPGGLPKIMNTIILPGGLPLY